MTVHASTRAPHADGLIGPIPASTTRAIHTCLTALRDGAGVRQVEVHFQPWNGTVGEFDDLTVLHLAANGPVPDATLDAIPEARRLERLIRLAVLPRLAVSARNGERRETCALLTPGAILIGRPMAGVPDETEDARPAAIHDHDTDYGLFSAGDAGVAGTLIAALGADIRVRVHDGAYSSAHAAARWTKLTRDNPAAAQDLERRASGDPLAVVRRDGMALLVAETPHSDDRLVAILGPIAAAQRLAA